MAEARCHTSEDLLRLLLQQLPGQFVQVGNQTVVRHLTEEEKRRRVETRQRLEEEAPALWAGLVRENERFYRRDGYLDVELDKKGRPRRKPLGRGRPRAPQPKKKTITVRLDQATFDKLQDYCKTKNILASEAVRRAVRLLR
ncbi:hypothetical protein SDD30_15945 [Moorella naiadis]|uniref:hypothetical protein n=1 Tax=Moorella naiadis (nom. illeg.) TaxID=3093670 RepID=UPI003D9CB7A5